MNFKDQYKHPNWQRVRLEALEAANFTCQRCQDDESQLHVHHKRYVKGRMIWEYEGSDLEVLCDSCHEQAHMEKDALQELIAKLPTHSITEIYALLCGYCSVAKTDVVGCVIHDDPWAFEAGRLAAYAAVTINNIGDFQSVNSGFASVKRMEGGEFTVKLSPRKRGLLGMDD